jgi:SAM-dependent methyltransferase
LLVAVPTTAPDLTNPQRTAPGAFIVATLSTPRSFSHETQRSKASDADVDAMPKSRFNEQSPRAQRIPAARSRQPGGQSEPGFMLVWAIAMEYTAELGVAVPELSWVPAPTFVLRRAAILDRSRRWPVGRVLEVGCGPGAILYELARLGFTGVGVEPSPQARTVAADLLAETRGVSVLSDLPDRVEPFDYLLAFEVLEHIEDDRGALHEWLGHLRSGGQVLLSVPAHRSRWNETDLLAGHYRRYDRNDIEQLASRVGLEVIELSTYGWPATWFIERARLAVRRLQLRRQGGLDDIRPGDAERSHASGVDRQVEARLYPLYSTRPGRALFASAARLQKLFYATDWGISYLLLARKP